MLFFKGLSSPLSLFCFSVHLLDTSASLVREKPDDWLVGKMVTASWEPNRVPEGAFLEVLGYRVCRYSRYCIYDKSLIYPSPHV